MTDIAIAVGALALIALGTIVLIFTRFALSSGATPPAPRTGDTPGPAADTSRIATGRTAAPVGRDLGTIETKARS